MSNVFSGYRDILVATDFSADSDAAAKQAVWLAQRTAAKITLAHTLPDLRRLVHSASTKAKLDLLQGEGEIFQREVRRTSDAKLRQTIAALGATELEVRFETLLGEPFVELTHAVQSEGFDLVLAGTRGRAAWEQFFIGSTAKRLIRKCPAAVWVVKAEHVGPPRVVLAATDFSDVSLKGVLHALWIAEQAQAEFHLLHVVDSMDIPEDIISHIPQGSSLRDEINAEAKTRLEDFLSSIHVGRDKIQSHLSWGSPWKEVCKFASRISADLIAMGTVGRSGIRGVLLGRTAEKVLGSCDCSILTVKPDDFVSPIQPAAWPLHPGD